MWFVFSPHGMLHGISKGKKGVTGGFPQEMNMELARFGCLYANLVLFSQRMMNLGYSYDILAVNPTKNERMGSMEAFSSSFSLKATCASSHTRAHYPHPINSLKLWSNLLCELIVWYTRVGVCESNGITGKLMPSKSHLNALPKGKEREREWHNKSVYCCFYCENIQVIQCRVKAIVLTNNEWRKNCVHEFGEMNE